MKLKNNLVVVAKISSKNQITIPKQIRNKLDIQAEDELAFEVYEDGNIILKKNNKNNFWNIIEEQQELYGILIEDEVEWGNDVGEEVVD